MSLICLISLGLVGCTSTPYHPMNLNGGYAETQLNQTTYRVYAKGNQLTSAQKVDDILMRRCAELTLQNGYKYFVILNKSSKTEKSYFTTRKANSTTTVSKDFMTQEPIYHTTYQPANKIETEYVSSELIMQMTNTSSANSIDAALIIKQISQH